MSTGTIGIIGAGHIGQAFARLAHRADREVVIANSRGPESIAPVVEALGTGVSAGTTDEAAASAMVVIAVPWTSVPTAVAEPAWSGKIVIDATNAFLFPDTPDMKLAELDGRSSSEIVADLVAGARVVKAANTLPAELLGADPHDAGRRRVLFLSGDDGAAKAEVAELFDAAGFFPIDLGDLAIGGRTRRLRAARFQASTWCGCREVRCAWVDHSDRDVDRRWSLLIGAIRRFLNSEARRRIERRHRTLGSDPSSR